MSFSNHPVVQFDSRETHVDGVSWSPCGTYFTLSAFNNFRIWTSEGRPVGVSAALGMVGGFGSYGKRAYWSPDGSRIVTVGTHAMIWKVSDLLEGSEGSEGPVPLTNDSATIIDGISGYSEQVRWCDEGVILVIDGQTGVWDVDTGEFVRECSIEWAYCEKGDIYVTSDFTMSGRSVCARDGQIYLAQRSPDESKIASCANDGTLRVWNAKRFTQLSSVKLDPRRRPRRGANMFTCIRWSPDSTMVVVGTRTQGVIVWNVVTNVHVTTLYASGRSSYNYPTYMDWSRGGTRLAVGYVQGNVQVWTMGPTDEQKNALNSVLAKGMADRDAHALTFDYFTQV